MAGAVGQERKREGACYVRGGIERIVEEEGTAAASLQYP